MTRFTGSVLASTALLGVLLWVVLNIGRDLGRIAESRPEEEIPEAFFDPTLVRINSAADLNAWLDSRALEGSALTAEYRYWLIDRGYPADGHWFAPSGSLPDPFDDTDDALLMTLAGQGDIDASHTLAERSLGSNPLEALDWYDQAMVNGSIYAMVRVSDLLATLADPALRERMTDPVWQQALLEIDAAPLAPQQRALAWAIAAVYIGGYPVLNTELEARLISLSNGLTDGELRQACDAAQEYVLDTAAARRAYGGAVFSTERPAFSISIAQPEDAIPCTIEVPPLVLLSDCERREFVGPKPKLMEAWFCTTR